MSKRRAVGIDLGTTYTVAAVMDARGRTEVISNSEGEALTPSAVLFDDTEIVVGREARKAAFLQPDRLAFCAKRDMGALEYSRRIAGRTVRPEVIQAFVLAEVKKDILRAVGPDFSVVITVPAFFDESRRRATVAAGRIAGLDVLDIINEPTAAVLSYGESQGFIATEQGRTDRQRVLVYDLGGGTFDVTVVDVAKDFFQTLATDGDVRLGGRDWDDALLELVCDQVSKTAPEDPRQNERTLERLRTEVELAKHSLSARQRATLYVSHSGPSSKVDITRSDFEHATAHLLERTAFTTRQLLKNAGLTWSGIDTVLMVGGATRMPMVSSMLAGMSGASPQYVHNPDEGVARGAALYAQLMLEKQGNQMPSYMVSDVNAHSLGVRGIEVETDQPVHAKLIPKNTSIPTQATRRFVTKRANQRTVVVEILEGESNVPAECSSLGRAIISQLPPNLPAGRSVDVTFEYASSGRLHVRAEMTDGGHQVALEVQRTLTFADQWVDMWAAIVRSARGVGDLDDAARSSILESQATDKASNGVSLGTAEPSPPATTKAAADSENADSRPTSNPARRRIARNSRPQRALRELLGIVLGGAFGLVVGYVVVLWMLGIDPFGLASKLPEAYQWVVPQSVVSPD